MSQIQTNTIQQNLPNFVITLRKLNVRLTNFNGTKITVIIKVQRKEKYYYQHQNQKQKLNIGNINVYQNSQPRMIKNGTASFYGESISIGPTVKKICVIVISVGDGLNKTIKQTNKELIKFQIDQEDIQNITQRKSTFSSGTQMIQLIWQARIHYQSKQNIECQQIDRSLQDFQDIEPKKQEGQQNQLLLGRKNYSPAVRGQTRRKRHSLKPNRGSLVSESPYKLTNDTKQTSDQLKKKIKVQLMSPSKKKIKDEMLQSIYIQNCLQKKEQKQDIQQKRKNIQKQKQLHPVLSQTETKKLKTKSFHIKEPITPQNQPKNSHIFLSKKKTQRFYQKISLKSLLYTSVIGIIGGVAAAQF